MVIRGQRHQETRSLLAQLRGQLLHERADAVGTPLQPGAIRRIGRWFAAGAAFVERRRERVIAEITGQAGVVVELNAIGVVVGGDLQDQLGEHRLHLGMHRVEPGHLSGGADRGGAAIAAAAEPGGLAAGEHRAGRHHEAELEPRHHQQSLAMALADQLRQDVLSLQAAVLEVLQAVALTDSAWVVGEAAVPDHRIDGVEMQRRQLPHRLLHARAIAQHIHVVGGEPHRPDLLAQAVGRPRGRRRRGLGAGRLAERQSHRQGQGQQQGQQRHAPATQAPSRSALSPCHRARARWVGQTLRGPCRLQVQAGSAG